MIQTELFNLISYDQTGIKSIFNIRIVWRPRRSRITKNIYWCHLGPSLSHSLHCRFVKEWFEILNDLDLITYGIKGRVRAKDPISSLSENIILWKRWQCVAHLNSFFWHLKVCIILMFFLWCTALRSHYKICQIFIKKAKYSSNFTLKIFLKWK